MAIPSRCSCQGFPLAGLMKPRQACPGMGSLSSPRDASTAVPFAGSARGEAEHISQGHIQIWIWTCIEEEHTECWNGCHWQFNAFNITQRKDSHKTRTDRWLPSSFWAGRGRMSLVQCTQDTLQVYRHIHICRSSSPPLSTSTDSACILDTLHGPLSLWLVQLSAL